MIKQKELFIWHKFNNLIRYCLAHTATKMLPLYIVNEYPKSGGTWVGEMLSDLLDIPFPRNRLPVFSSSILHGHMMQSWNMKNVLIVWRDGRDVLISQYYHSLFFNDKANSRLVRKCRADLGFSNYEDIRSNLIPFMNYVYKVKKNPRFSWAEFVNKWAGNDKCVHTKYEELRSNTVEEIRRIIYNLNRRLIKKDIARKIVEKHSFEKISGRKIGQENKNSFMRKGLIGDWKNYFDKKAAEKFAAYAGEELIKLGYETDNAWIKRF